MSSRATLLKSEPATGSFLPSDSFSTMYRFWLNAKGGAELPLDSALDAARFPLFALPNISVTRIENGPKRYFIKLVGEAIVRSLGVDASGKYAEDLPGAGSPVERMDTCIRARQPYFFSAPVTWTNDYVTYAALILPYAELGGRISRLLTYADYA